MLSAGCPGGHYMVVRDGKWVCVACPETRPMNTPVPLPPSERPAL